MTSTALQPGDRLIDFSGMRMDDAKIAQATTAGAKGVIRYSAGVGNGDAGAEWKLITPSEFRQLVDAGFDVIANSEWYESRVTEGARAGAADGLADLHLWRSCGLAKGATIYVSWDAYPTRRKFRAVRRYLRAYNRALGGHYRADLYGGTPILRWLLAKGVTRFGWRTNAGAWNNDGLPYQPDTSTSTKRAALVTKALDATPAHVWQTGNYWFGKGADENLVVRTPLGSHLEALAARRPHPPQPTPDPPPVPPTPPVVVPRRKRHYKRGARYVHSPNGAFALFVQDDGSAVVRHRGRHVRNL